MTINPKLIVPKNTYLYRLTQSIERKPIERYSSELKQQGIFMSNNIYLPMMMIPENKNMFNFLSVYITNIDIECFHRDSPFRNVNLYGPVPPIFGVIVLEDADDKYITELHISNSDDITFIKSYYVSKDMWESYIHLIYPDIAHEVDVDDISYVVTLKDYCIRDFLDNFEHQVVKYANDSWIVPDTIPEISTMKWESTFDDVQYSITKCIHFRTFTNVNKCRNRTFDFRDKDKLLSIKFEKQTHHYKLTYPDHFEITTFDDNGCLSSYTRTERFRYL